MWSEIIYKSHQRSIQDINPVPEVSVESLTKLIAEGLYTDLLHSGDFSKDTDKPSNEFVNLPDPEKSFWYDYASGIPDKFLKLNLFIRPFENFCRTCIITDKEIDKIAQSDIVRYCRKLMKKPSASAGIKENGNKTHQYLVPAPGSGSDPKQFYRDLNCLIPVELKKNGYEIIRQEEAAEINMQMTKRLARTIHSRYLHELRTRQSQSEEEDQKYFFNLSVDPEKKNFPDFDNLPDEIKFSNIDNAIHIPTKLLSIGYKIRPVKKGFKPVTLHLDDEEIETMARVEHMRWSWEKRLTGWTFGTIKDQGRKTHPSLIPYDDLSEPEKEKDRKLVKLIPALLQDIDYEAYPVSPNRIKRLSYAIKSQGTIKKILDETRELNEQIRMLVTLTPDIEEMVRLRNQKIEEAIIEVEGSYRYARHIQETFLPDDLYVRECFPESFVLFKPKDLVSGDFYFFSKQEELVIFAAADCTGHGIPGALLSTLGYGILDQAVNEIKLKDSKYILFHLYSKIHRYLRNNNEESVMPDDMDIILCVFDMKAFELTYSSVKNPLYHITRGGLIEYKANNSTEECNEYDRCMFSSATIQLHPGDTIYLSSDGFPDQFGGQHHKKYLRSRFKSMLKMISEYPMPEQSDMLYEEIELWREENHEDQTDDIMVIGVRF